MASRIGRATGATFVPLLTASLSALSASAQIEVEVDPVAYAFGGYSLHGATVLGDTRLNLGVFGLDVPEAVHGNTGWSSSMHGAGIKWDYVGASSDGLFVGVDGGYMRVDYTPGSHARTEVRDVIGIGVRAGYRLPIGNRGFYVVPWASLSHNFDGDEVVIGAERFDRRQLQVFPAVHVGWRF